MYYNFFVPRKRLSLIHVVAADPHGRHHTPSQDVPTCAKRCKATPEDGGCPLVFLYPALVARVLTAKVAIAMPNNSHQLIRYFRREYETSRVTEAPITHLHSVIVMYAVMIGHITHRCRRLRLGEQETPACLVARSLTGGSIVPLYHSHQRNHRQKFQKRRT